MSERINYKNLPTAAEPYVHAVKHKDTLYVSLAALGTKSQKLDSPRAFN